MVETECSDWSEDTFDPDEYKPNGEIHSSVAMATMKKRDLLFLVFVCAKFRRGFFFYYS